MRRLIRGRLSKGFTLLEVLLATAIMAVGTTSVLVVIATAAGMASQRQVGLRRAQVADEALHDAQAMVDAYRPNAAPAATAKPAASPKAAPGAKKPETRSAPAAMQQLGPPEVKGKVSSRYGGFTYDISFAPKDRMVLEKGYDVAVVVHYGGGELSYSTSTSMISTTIAPDEFDRSATFIEEQQASTTSKPKGDKK